MACYADFAYGRGQMSKPKYLDWFKKMPKSDQTESLTIFSLSHPNVGLDFYLLAGCIWACSKETHAKRRTNRCCNGNTSTDVLVPIHSQGLPQLFPDAKNEKGHRLRFRHCLVGLRP